MVTGFPQCKPYQRARWEMQKLLLMWPYKSLSHVYYILLVHMKAAHVHGEAAIQGHDTRKHGSLWEPSLKTIYHDGASYGKGKARGTRSKAARAGWPNY